MWLRRSDSFMAFCQECIEEDSDSIIEKKYLRNDYKDYCKKHKLKPSTDKRIREILSSLYGVSDSKSGNSTSWNGIKLNNGKDGKDILTPSKKIKSCIDRETLPKLPNFNEESLSCFSDEKLKLLQDAFDLNNDSEISIDDLILQGFSELELDKWKFEGVLCESRAGFVRLLR